MNSLRKFLTSIVCFLLPNKFSFWILNILGHKVHHSAKIGFSFIWLNGKLSLNKSSKIGHFNFIKIKSLAIEKNGYIGRMNKMNGPIEIVLGEKAAIGNRNSIYRGPIGVSYGSAILKLGSVSKITANHRLDCTRSIVIGNYSILAGHESQLWTHGYYHDSAGPGRFRVDGEIEIGNNVYIGSRCIINAGVKIGDAIVVGANSCVSKSLLEVGTYVSQSLRFIEKANEVDQRDKFNKIDGFDICEEVYEKKSK